MKCITLVFVLVLLSSIGLSQPQRGSFELGLSGSGGHLARQSERDYFEDSPYWNDYQDSYNTTFFILFARPAYYVLPQVSIEPEVAWALESEAAPALDVSLNAAYHFRLQAPNILPFLFAGYGIANSHTVNNTVIGRYSDEMDIRVINAGAGVKAYLGNHVALRVEYRYQNRRFEGEIMGSFGGGGIRQIGKSIETYHLHTALFGFSYLL